LTAWRRPPPAKPDDMMRPAPGAGPEVPTAMPFNPFAAAQAQFDRIAGLLELDEPTRELLRQPLREHHFSIPVRMDSGRAKVFRGFRIVHNDARGAATGGVRFHPQETADTARAQAMWMSWKAAVVDLPMGGSKGSVACEPHGLSAREQEGICRGWVRQLAKELGPLVDVPAPDVMTTPQHMLWMLDEFEALTGARYPGFITGKPVGMGGSLGRKEATGYGLVFMLREALRELGLDPERTRAGLQGFGSVGQAAAELYQRLGGTVFCVSSWDHADQTAYAFRKSDGIDVEELRGITDRFGGIQREAAVALGYEVLPGEAWLEQPVDILIPAALENQITGENAGRVHRRVRVVAEGANGPTDAQADRILAERGVLLIPDFIANAGGIICDYFEQVQSNQNYYWNTEEVLGKLDVRMTSAFEDVSELSRKRALSMRDAAYVIAVDRVAAACHDRGWV
jgi:glutamate dehydrogenase